MSTKQQKKLQTEAAANQRANHVRALEEERDACKAAGKSSRVSEINKEIKRVKDLESRGEDPYVHTEVSAQATDGTMPEANDPALAEVRGGVALDVDAAPKPLKEQTLDELLATAERLDIDLGEAKKKPEVLAVLLDETEKSGSVAGAPAAPGANPSNPA